MITKVFNVDLFSRSELFKIRNLTVKFFDELEKYLNENGLNYMDG